MVLSSLKTLVWTYWPHLVLLLVAGIVIAWKLRLMKKFGFYLVGVGVFFFSSGMVTAGNPILLLIGVLESQDPCWGARPKTHVHQLKPERPAV